MKKNLTPQQEKFIKNYVSGQNATEAYKSAYSVKGQDNRSISVKASQLLSKEIIIKEIEERKEKQSLLLNYTAEDSFKKIVEIQTLAEEKKDITNILKAEEMKQKLAGINRENATLNFGIVGDFKEFYAAICAKKDYGITKSINTQSKTVALSNCPESQVIENK